MGESGDSPTGGSEQARKAPGGPERPPEAASLTGTAKLERSAGDDITFTFDAHLAAADQADPRRATGTFRFSHYLDGAGAWAEAEVDCLRTGGKVAVVSGIITDSDLPGAEGKRVGVSVHDQGRHDRLGYSWAATGSPAADEHLAPCLSSAPFEKVRKGTGDFRVSPGGRTSEPPPAPATSEPPRAAGRTGRLGVTRGLTGAAGGVLIRSYRTIVALAERADRVEERRTAVGQWFAERT